jgi:hypothetical protein
MSDIKKRGRKPKIMQIHGKDESVKATNMATSLDDILKENLSFYKSKNADEYKSLLAEMNMSDLQAHAYKIGLVPTDNRQILTSRLVDEFIRWNSRFNTRISNDNVSSSDELSAKVQKILREGA